MISKAGQVWQARWVPLLLGSAAFIAVTAVTCLIAHPRMFTVFHSYDDEGYMLIALKSFMKHGSLYDDVFSQYGPFYYELWGSVFSVFGISVNHDGGRTVTMIVWVLSSLLVGLSLWRMTRSILLGLATQMLVFGALVTLINEPMHPGGVICLLVSVIVVLSCFVGARVSPMAMALLGGVVMALILVKINVGVFALAAVALACVASYPSLSNRRWPRSVVEVGFVAIPLVLMLSKAGESWARHYSVHVAVAAFAVVIALRSRPTGRRDTEEIWWLVGGLVVVALTVCLAIIAAGTSPGGLFDGIIVQPLRQSDAFSLRLDLSNRIYAYDSLALIGALGYWHVARKREEPPSRDWISVTSVLSILIGLEMALSVIGRTALFDSVTFSGFQLGMLAFAWVALIPPPGDQDDATGFARLLLPPLAVLQALHAFPVAGSQLLLSAFLLVPVGALCVSNGVRGLAFSLRGRAERRAFLAVGAVAVLVTMAVLVNLQLRQPLDQARAAYDGGVSLGLPGAGVVRISPEEAAQYRSITVAIDAHCDSFVMLPGMSSFYIWSEEEPPTGFNATAWPTLFDDAHQRRVIDETRSIEGLCLLRNIPLAEGWGEGKIPSGPLVRYLERGFRPIATFGDYELLKRAEGSG